MIKRIFHYLFGDRKTYVMTPVGKIEYNHYKSRYLKCIRETEVNGRVLRYNEFCELIESAPPASARNTFKASKT